jgi:hypothetical protein
MKSSLIAGRSPAGMALLSTNNTAIRCRQCHQDNYATEGDQPDVSARSLHCKTHVWLAAGQEVVECLEHEVGTRDPASK